MLRSLFGLSLLTLLACLPANADEDCGKDERCQRLHHPARVLPPVPNMVCIYYMQPTPGKVLLTVYLKDGNVHTYDPKESQAKDSQCINRIWVPKASKIELCKETPGNAIYEGTDLEFLATKAEFSQEETACLYGIEKCKAMGFKTRSQP